jgi:DNA-binding MarR family transcriptional regulator
MNINELEIDIQRNKERSPETFNEIVNITIPFYMFYRKMFGGVSRLEEVDYQITHNEIDILSCLKMSGNEEYILSPSRLNERLLFTAGTITKVLKKLEDKKYIVRLDNKFDKRGKLVQLTTLGREVHDKVMVDILKFEENCFSFLNDEEKQTMKNLLVKLLKS